MGNMKLLLVGFSALLLSGCASLRSVNHTLYPQGPVSLNGSSYSLDAVGRKGTTGQIALFESSYKAAYQDNADINNSAKSIPKTASDPISIRARKMAIDGVALADTYCSDFFLHAGDNQKWIDVGKDSIAILGTLATGALAISSKSNSEAAAATALFTATAYNGIDLYTRNFLFGSDNIESVRVMIKKILSDHIVSAFPANDDTIWTFEGAVEVINDHQVLCTPAAIRDKVLKAISGGEFAAYTPAGKLLVPSGTDTAVSTASKVPAATAAATAAAPTASSAAAPAAVAAASAASVAAETEAAKPGANASSIAAAASTAAVTAARRAAAAAAPTVAASQVNAAADAAANIISSEATKAALSNTRGPTTPPPTRHVIMDLAKPN